jgi:hypothetical protein
MLIFTQGQEEEDVRQRVEHDFYTSILYRAHTEYADWSTSCKTFLDLALRIVLLAGTMHIPSLAYCCTTRLHVV